MYFKFNLFKPICQYLNLKFLNFFIDCFKIL
nr:MAG TPA: hypothetical protein [Caudoviricetes sp.]